MFHFTYFAEVYSLSNCEIMMIFAKLLVSFVICYLFLDGNNNKVLAACSKEGEECCWLVRYEGLVKDINDRPGFQAEITEAFQVGKIRQYR